jgi:hypothetical protein
MGTTELVRVSDSSRGSLEEPTQKKGDPLPGFMYTVSGVRWATMTGTDGSCEEPNRSSTMKPPAGEGKARAFVRSFSVRRSV